MHFRVWLTHAVLFGYASSAILPTASRRQKDLVVSSSKVLSRGYVSAKNTSSSHEVADVNLFALNNASQQPSNYSTSIYDLPFGYNLPAVTTYGPQCDAAVSGSNLDRHSCFDAWRYIGLTSQRASWGPRGAGPSFQYRLPHRWSSGKSTIPI